MGLWSDIGTIAGGGLGAAVGTLLMPGVGTVTAAKFGAGLGGILGGTQDSGDPGGEYQNNGYDEQIKAVVNSMIQSHIGRDEATLEAGQAKRDAQKNVEKFNGQFGNNAAASAAFYNSANENAEGAAARAYTRGAAIDQQTKQQALGPLENLSGSDYQRWLERKRRAGQPGFATALGQLGLSTAFGNTLGKSDEGTPPKTQSPGLNLPSFNPQAPTDSGMMDFDTLWKKFNMSPAYGGSDATGASG